MTSPFFVWASSKSSDPRVFSRLANDSADSLRSSTADVNADDASERHVEMVLPGRREPQRFLADALELAEEFFVARQVEPRVEQRHGRLRRDRRPAWDRCAPGRSPWRCRPAHPRT